LELTMLLSLEGLLWERLLMMKLMIAQKREEEGEGGGGGDGEGGRERRKSEAG